MSRVLSTAGLDRLSPGSVVFFQSRARGFLVRQRLFSMLQYYYDREDQVVRAQAVAKGILTRLNLEMGCKVLCA